MRTTKLILMLLLVMVIGCKKEEPVEPTPPPTPVIEEGYGCIELHLTKMNLKSLYLVNGYDKYTLVTSSYLGNYPDYYKKFCDIRNITYDYTIAYNDNTGDSKGRVTVIKDQTTKLQGR